MANLNRILLIGRLTRDPEPHTFQGGGKVVNFGFAVNNRRKNQQTGEWEDEPCFLDCKAFNRPNGRQLADQIEQYLKKGDLAFIEGRLVMEQWDGTDGPRKAIRVYCESVEFLTQKKRDHDHTTLATNHSRPDASTPSTVAADEDIPF